MTLEDGGRVDVRGMIYLGKTKTRAQGKRNGCSFFPAARFTFFIMLKVLIAVPTSCRVQYLNGRCHTSEWCDF